MGFDIDEVLAHDKLLNPDSSSGKQGFDVDKVLNDDASLRNSPNTKPGIYDRMNNSAPMRFAAPVLDPMVKFGKGAIALTDKTAGNIMSGLSQMGTSSSPVKAGAISGFQDAISPALVGAQSLVEGTMPKDRIGAALTLAQVGAEPAAAGIKAATEAATPAAKSVAQGLYKILPNIYPSTAKYLTNNWNAVMNAPKLKAAKDFYSAAAGGLKHWSESVAERFGTLTPSSKINEVIEEGQKYLQGDKGVEMNPQKALDFIQSVNLKQRSVMAEVKDSTLRSQMVDEFASMKDKMYDFLEKNGKPALREAGRILRNAFVKDEVTNLLPVNKGGDRNVLRGVGAGYKILEGGGQILEGQPIKGAINMGIGTMFSPKMFTGVANNIVKAAEMAGSPEGISGALGLTNAAKNASNSNALTSNGPSQMQDALASRPQEKKTLLAMLGKYEKLNKLRPGGWSDAREGDPTRQWPGGINAQ